MADIKLTALPQESVPALTDFIYLTDITPTSSKQSLDRLFGLLGFVCNGRLTTEPGVPVSTGDRLAQNSIKFTPFNGNRVALYDGTRWRLYTFAEVSFTLVSLTIDKNYDVYLFDNAGTLTLELSAAWTNDTTRADATALQDGVLCKSGALTRRLVGTIRTTSTNGTEDSLAKRYVGNLYNKVERPLFRNDPATSWNYTTATIRQANANAANQVEIVSPDATVAHVTLSVHAQNTLINTALSCIVGLDSTTAAAASSVTNYVNAPAANDIGPLIAAWAGYLTPGRHILTWLEQSQALGTTTWLGNAAGPIVSGLVGSVLL